MIGTTAINVSTLFTTVGHPHKPLTAGNGGFILGFPLFPSSDSIKAVSSPQIYAPPPGATRKSRSKPDPKIFFPKNPFA